MSNGIEALIKDLTDAVKANTAAVLGSKASGGAPAAASTGSKAGGGKAPSEKEVAEKATAFKDAKGMPALRALMKENGSDSGKMADLPKAKWAAFIAAVDAGLAEPESSEDDESL